MRQSSLFDDPPTRTEQRVPLPDTVFVLEVHDEQGTHWQLLSRERLSVGSSSRSTLRVHDALVSREHCELRVNGQQISFVDLNSKNGSYLGGARIREARLSVGSVLVLGQSSLRVQAYSAESLLEVEPIPGLAGGSAAMRRVAAQVRRLATLPAAVLVRGETGTGKEVVARALHDLGPRAGGSFVPLNVANLPRELVESELFGHERGAFTGAVAKRAGAFAEAARGTLFLDEIGELPLEAQPKLLRALDGYEVRRVGGRGESVCARVVAATHVPLERHVEEGLFRRDLFHRLEVCVVELPPLRERPEDIPALVKILLGRMRELGELKIASEALARLCAYSWPGNVRELRNVLYRAALAAEGQPIEAAHVDAVIVGFKRPTHISGQLAKAILRENSGNLSAAARSLGISRTSFRKQLRSA